MTDPRSAGLERPAVATRERRNGRVAALLATTALFAASTGSTHAQTTDWTGAVSSDWFLAENWTALRPTQTKDANINTVTPNSTVVASPGASAKNLSVGLNGTGTLTIQTGGTLADSSGTIGNLPGGLTTVTVTGSTSADYGAGGRGQAEGGFLSLAAAGIGRIDGKAAGVIDAV